MSLTVTPNETSLSQRLEAFANDLTPINGMDLIGPLALKAIDHLQNPSGSSRDLNVCLNAPGEAAWITAIKATAKDLPHEVIQNLKALINTFLVAEDDESKITVTNELLRVLQENKIDFREIFVDVAKILVFSLSTIKEINRRQIELKLNDPLLEDLKDSLRKRIQMIWDYHHPPCFSLRPIGLHKEKADEVYRLELKLYDEMAPIIHDLYRNSLLRNEFRDDRETWAGDLQELDTVDSVLHEKQTALKTKHAEALKAVEDKYEVLFQHEREQQQALREQREAAIRQRNEAIRLREKQELERKQKEKVEELPTSTDQSLSNEELLRLLNEHLAPEKRKRKCIVM